MLEKTITFLNEKGGTMKTTLAVHLAAGLAILGARVVLLDTDPQANATSILGLPKSGALYDLIVRNAPWREVLRAVHPDVYGLPDTPPAGQLFAVPSNVETRNIATTISDGAIFQKRLRELQTAVDYVVIDTSPTPSLLHAAITLATDYLLFPTQAESASAFEGLADSLLHGQAVREAAGKKGLDVARILGIIPVMFRANTIAHNTVKDDLTDLYGELVWSPISASIIYAEMSYMRQLVYGYKPDSIAAQELWGVVNRVQEAIHEQA